MLRVVLETFVTLTCTLAQGMKRIKLYVRSNYNWLYRCCKLLHKYMKRNKKATIFWSLFTLYSLSNISLFSLNPIMVSKRHETSIATPTISTITIPTITTNLVTTPSSFVSPISVVSNPNITLLTKLARGNYDLQCVIYHSHDCF